MKRTRAPWLILFIAVVLVIALLAASWNWVLVENSRAVFDAARDKWVEQSRPWMGIVLGSLGFIVLIFVFSIFFAKVLREMKLNQLQKDFLANITHELKTPLASLELSSSLLKTNQGLNEEEKAKLWENHDIELHRLRDEIERLLTSSRWEHLQEKPILKIIKLESWLEQNIKAWEHKISQSIQLERIGNLFPQNLEIEADPHLMNLILGNLIENSIKFSGKTSAKIYIETEISSNHLWRIHVRDEGIGFEADDIQHIFKRFKRLKHAQKNAIPGSGLGLHLAHKAALAMNMELIAFSEGRNRGACFTLEGDLL